MTAPPFHHPDAGSPSPAARQRLRRLPRSGSDGARSGTIRAVTRGGGTDGNQRRRILASARDAFVLDGFAATSLAGVATRSGTDLATVQRLFGDRFGLFGAVFEEALREANGAALSAARSGPQDGWEPIKSGCRRIVEIYAHPGPGRTILMDARRVLGLDEWYDLDRRFGTASLGAGLRAAAEQGLIDPAAIPVLTVVLYGAMTEACLSAGSGQLPVDIDALMDAIDRILRAYAA